MSEKRAYSPRRGFEELRREKLGVVQFYEERAAKAREHFNAWMRKHEVRIERAAKADANDSND
jgi:hypothetical protein